MLNARYLDLRGQSIVKINSFGLKSIELLHLNRFMNLNSDITGLLSEYQAGNRAALDELFPLIYDELKRVAANKLKNERADHTLQPTALVHEAYLRLISQESVDWTNRVQFFGIAAEMMRRILTNHAVSRNTDKRGGQQLKVELDDALMFTTGRGVDLIALDEALTELAEIDRKQAQIVELRFYTGLKVEEVAELLKISDSTVKREWRMAKAWLFDRLGN